MIRHTHKQTLKQRLLLNIYICRYIVIKILIFWIFKVSKVFNQGRIQDLMRGVLEAFSEQKKIQISEQKDMPLAKFFIDFLRFAFP